MDGINAQLREDIALYQKFESGIEGSLQGVLDNLPEGDWGRFTDDLAGARFLAFSNPETGMLATMRIKKTQETVLPLYTSVEEILRTQPFPPGMRIGVMNYGEVCHSLALNKNIDGIVINPAGRYFPLPSGSVVEILHLAVWKKMMLLMKAMGAGPKGGGDKPAKAYH